MSSIWSNTELKHYPALNKNIKTDTVIIGGGMAGLLIANALTEKGVDNLVIEAKEIGSGQTKNTTAKITSQHAVIYSKIAKHYGQKAARQYARANEKAIADFARIIAGKSIDCSFEKTSAVLYSNNSLDILTEEYEAADEAEIDCFITDKTELPFPVKGALVFRNQAKFHPLKFIEGILGGLTVFENTPALRIGGNTVYTPHAKITADNIIVACHYPFINFPGEYFFKMSQERSYVLAVESDVKLNGLYYGIDKDGLSFRSYDGKILLGGGAHRTGTASSRPYDMLKSRADEIFQHPKTAAKWSAQDCITLDGIPYIGQFQKSNPHIYVATGFNKWGMTSAMVSANILSELICGEESPCAAVFSPERFCLSAAAVNLLKNTGETVKGFASHLVPAFSSEKDVPRGCAKEINYNGFPAGAYRDNDGKLYIVTLRCPHLKCKLKWNDAEKTWDCPCHGSRYDYKGNLIDNPAQKGSILLEKTEN